MHVLAAHLYPELSNIPCALTEAVDYILHHVNAGRRVAGCTGFRLFSYDNVDYHFWKAGHGVTGNAESREETLRAGEKQYVTEKD